MTSSTPTGSAKKVSPGSGASCSTGDGKTKSLMSKHLVDPTAATPSAPKKPRPCARLLTSADSLKEMEEKEGKKKEEIEEKERQKKNEKKRRNREKNRRERQQSGPSVLRKRQRRWRRKPKRLKRK